MISDVLDGVTLKDIIYFIVGSISVISLIIEKIKSLPFNPWSSLFRWIGDCLTSNLNSKLNELEEQQKANNEAIIKLDKKVDKKFEETKRSADEKEVKRLRGNIISFADSCRCGDKHTQNHFENIMRDYDDYENYCKEHGILNHYIDNEYAYIEALYQERLRKNDFL